MRGSDISVFPTAHHVGISRNEKVGGRVVRAGQNRYSHVHGRYLVLPLAAVAVVICLHNTEQAADI